MDAFLQRALGVAELHPIPPNILTLTRDPDDEPYTDLAIATHARYLVTWDKDLLDLTNVNRPEGQTFRERFPNLEILDPPTFLREISKRTTDRQE